MTQTKMLLTVSDVREQMSLGRDLATRIMELLPHVTAGRAGNGIKRLVQRSDLERVMVCAAADGVDLWDLVRREDAREVVNSWLARGMVN